MDLAPVFGWKSASPNKGGFYKAVIDWFVDCDDSLFRCVVVNKGNLWSSDDEDGFYVAYHQLLFHWLVPGNTYHVYLDKKKNSRRRRVDTLRWKTEWYMPSGCKLACMEEVESRECALVQVSDLLIGCIFSHHLRTNHAMLFNRRTDKTRVCDALQHIVHRKYVQPLDPLIVHQFQKTAVFQRDKPTAVTIRRCGQTPFLLQIDLAV